MSSIMLMRVHYKIEFQRNTVIYDFFIVINIQLNLLLLSWKRFGHDQVETFFFVSIWVSCRRIQRFSFSEKILSLAKCMKFRLDFLCLPYIYKRHGTERKIGFRGTPNALEVKFEWKLSSCTNWFLELN